MEEGKFYRVTGSAMKYIDTTVFAENEEDAIQKACEDYDCDDPDPNLEAYEEEKHL